MSAGTEPCVLVLPEVILHTPEAVTRGSPALFLKGRSTHCHLFEPHCNGTTQVSLRGVNQPRTQVKGAVHANKTLITETGNGLRLLLTLF